MGLHHGPWRLDIRRPISYGRTSQNTKWSSAKYLVRKLPDEGTSGSFVTMYLAELHFGNGYMEIGLLISSLHGQHPHWALRHDNWIGSDFIQCAQIGHANHAHTISGYIRVNQVGAVGLVARATDFSTSEFENSEMLENLRETSALSLFRLFISYTN